MVPRGRGAAPGAALPQGPGTQSIEAAMTPDRPGLYREEYERDSCGFGLIANLDDQPSHWLVETAIQALTRLTHRGAIAPDGKTGDGCGLLLKKPESFLRELAREAGIAVGERFTAGNVFLSRDPQLAAYARATLEAAVRNEGLEVAGWRVVPTRPEVCGDEALPATVAIPAGTIRVTISSF